MNKPDPKISIVIPTYKQEEPFSKCLDSIDKCTDFATADCEIIVVSNGSSKSHEDLVRKRGAPYSLLSYPEPIGFLKAVNAGIVVSRGEYVLLLNDDTEILDWGGNNVWLKMLSDPLDDNQMLAVTGSTMDIWAKDQKFLVFYCVMIRRALLLAEGLLDETFHPGCGEDADFCMKVQRKGYSIMQVPVELPHWATQFPIWHIGNISIGGIPNLRDIADRNTLVLEGRYPRTEGDRELSRKFSDGLQNVHLWQDKPPTPYNEST